jgi:hypothetical protein
MASFLSTYKNQEALTGAQDLDSRFEALLTAAVTTKNRDFTKDLSLGEIA